MPEKGGLVKYDIFVIIKKNLNDMSTRKSEPKYAEDVLKRVSRKVMKSIHIPKTFEEHGFIVDMEKLRKDGVLHITCTL